MFIALKCASHSGNLPVRFWRRVRTACLSVKLPLHRARFAYRIDQVGAGELSAHLSAQCFGMKLSLCQAESVDTSPWCAATPISAQPGLPYCQIGCSRWCAGRNYHCTGCATLHHPALRHEIRAPRLQIIWVKYWFVHNLSDYLAALVS